MLSFPTKERLHSVTHSLPLCDFFCTILRNLFGKRVRCIFFGGARYEWQFYVSLFQPEATLVAEKRGGLISFGKGIIFKKIKLLLIYKIY